MKILRIILSLIVSLCLGAAICFALIATGVLKFQNHQEKSGIVPLTQKVISQIAPRKASCEKTNCDYSDPEGAKNILTPSTQTQDASERSDSVVSPTSASAKKSIETNVHARALAFLGSVNRTESGDIEERFAAFLTGELHITPETAKQMVRMSFWKNFITFEKQWHKEDWPLLEAEFKREMEFKKAGFKAMGITLMENEISEAEICLYNLHHRLMETTQEGDKT